jgi:hypothetical protein
MKQIKGRKREIRNDPGRMERFPPGARSSTICALWMTFLIQLVCCILIIFTEITTLDRANFSFGAHVTRQLVGVVGPQTRLLILTWLVAFLKGLAHPFPSSPLSCSELLRSSCKLVHVYGCP